MGSWVGRGWGCGLLVGSVVESVVGDNVGGVGPFVGSSVETLVGSAVGGPVANDRIDPIADNDPHAGAI
eukprot:CAMPEP_0172318544 /NCGR_PEP_ID=MMETSP1058-20130122/35187_1 /TAXON_ID=83371 /ORGANISM="Detonula confervacea, Strain CCMP 353" /LENGTH=68 /DNA_ID=CAMNT_0013033397 /DNA_START=1 /DNA_END=204 /DNA_ORIENTATION=-